MSTDATPGNEVALLLACARASVDSAGASRIRALAQAGLDWQQVVASAERHDVVPLLYRSLSTVCPDLAPADTLAKLKAWQSANSLRSLVLTRELLRVLRALEAGHVHALPFKGPVLGELAYGDLTLRHCVDLDILINKQDLGAARQILAGLGYALTDDCRRHEAAYAHLHHHFAFSHAGNKTMLELHWRLVTRQFSLRLSFDDLWQRSISIRVAGAPIRSPSVEDTFTIVCIHAAMHGWKQLKQVCDAAELVRRQPQIDWPAIMERAHRLGCRRIVLLGLALANGLLDAPLPAPLAAQVKRDEAVAALMTNVCQRMLAGASDAEPDMRSFFGYYVRLRERRRDQIEEGLRRILIPNMDEWDSRHIPDSLSFLHYLARPLYLVRAYVRALWRRLQRRPSPTGRGSPNNSQNP